MAEGIFRHLVKQANLTDAFEIDSAGTGDWHVGQAPDRRMRETARKNGVSLTGQQARQFEAKDLAYYDHIFAMDKNNLHDILYLDRRDQNSHKVRLFREFDPEPGDYQVPDPYYGGPQGFDNVYAIADRTARLLLHRLIEEHKLTSST